MHRRALVGFMRYSIRYRQLGDNRRTLQAFELCPIKDKCSPPNSNLRFTRMSLIALYQQVSVLANAMPTVHGVSSTASLRVRNHITRFEQGWELDPSLDWGREDAVYDSGRCTSCVSPGQKG